MSETLASSNARPGKLLDAALQAPGLADADIEKVRGLIGTWLRRDVHTQAIYEPIALHDIRRWAHYSVGDDNPLWSDTEYAKRTRWSRVIAPPTFLYTIDTGIVAPGLPGIQWIFAGGSFEHFTPVYVGDVISARARLIDVQVKSGRSAPRFVKQTGEVLFENQHGVIVSRYEGDILRVPRAKSGEGLRFESSRKAPKEGERHKYTPEEIEEIATAYREEDRRGSTARYWEDCAIDDALPVLYKGPLTLVDIVGFYAGRRTVYNVLKLAFKECDEHPRNVYYSPSEMAPAGVETLVSATADRDFDTIVTVGSGGVLVELLHDIGYLSVPITERDVNRILERLALAKLLVGFRGAPPADRRALVEAVLGLARAFVARSGELDEVEINPLIVLPDGQGVMAVDVLLKRKSGSGTSEHPSQMRIAAEARTRQLTRIVVEEANRRSSPTTAYLEEASCNE